MRERVNPTAFCRTTRGDQSVGFGDAVLRGLGESGGLFVPESFDRETHKHSRSSTSYAETASRWLKGWLGGADTTYERLYPFPVPVVRLEGGAWDGVYVLELFHGPTLSFKDFGARFLAAAMSAELETRSETRVILVATSGDTGSAVADAFAGVDRVRVVLLYPDGLVSPTQEDQLIARRPGVTSLAVEGSFDDCQRLVKECFASPIGPRLSSANSINIARLLPQQVYYSWAAKSVGSGNIVAVVPSGNLGNLTAGYLARMNGAPIAHFVAAHNRNDWLVRYLANPDASFATTIPTISNAMDVGAPSNAERLRYWSSPSELSRLVSGESIGDEDTMQTIQGVWRESNYMIDPHTAVGVAAAVRYRQRTGDRRPIVVLATAHPAKFPETILRATEVAVEVPERLQVMGTLGTDRTLVPPDLTTVLNVVKAQDNLFAAN